MEINTSFGVVVIAKNEGERLKRCLESLMDHVDVTVYVDSQSSDGSVNLASNMGFHVIVLDESKPISRPRARNEGFQFLKKLYPKMLFVQFQDGDTTLSSGWLNVARQKFNEVPDAAIVCGMLQEKDRHVSVYRKLCDIEWYREPGEVERTGGIAAVRVEALEITGTYREGIRGEDYEICHRFRNDGWKIFCVGQQMGIHDSGIDSFKEYWARGVKSGCAFLNGRKHGHFAEQRRSVLKWTFFLPVIVIVVIVNPLLGALALFVYPVKILQIAYWNMYRTTSFKDAVAYATHCVFVKYIELYGMLKYYFSKQKILSD